VYGDPYGGERNYSRETRRLEEHNVRSGFFSHEEYLAVHGVLPDYKQVAVSVAYYTGLRVGEVLGLKWSQVDLVEGKLSLTPLQTKTETSRVVYLPPDLHPVLLEARRRHEATYPASPWVCQRYGVRLLEIKRCWKQACMRMGLAGRLVHDFRRTAVRNMTRAGIPEKVAARALATYYEQEKVTLSVTLAELGRQRSDSVNREPVETSARFLEPAIRIERTTCGLRNRCSTN